MPRNPAPDDDAALRWDELGDTSYVESETAAAVASRAAAASAGVAAGGANDINADAGADADAGAGAGAGNGGRGNTSTLSPLMTPAVGGTSLASTVLTALFGLVYLAYSLGWIIGITLVPLNGPTLLIEVMYQFSEFLTILASAMWFATVLSLTRKGRAVHRFGWLALGTLVLIPWPIVLGVLA
jgi:hypothetical protein